MPGCFAILAAVLAAIAAGLMYVRNYSYEVTPAEIEAAGARWVRTPDGRLLEYFVCGDESAGASTLYVQHGYGNTGGAFLGGPCETARALGLRVLSPTQPGFGLSSHYPIGRVRKLEEWPADVALILEQEGVDNFYVSGFSAGCVHALAVAHAFEPRVLGVGLGTPTAPLKVEAGVAAMAAETRFVREQLEVPYIGDLLGYFMSKLTAKQRMASAPDCLAALEKLEANDPPVDWHPAALEAFTGDQTRGVLKGHRGWSDNMAVLNQDLPFDVHELSRLARPATGGDGAPRAFVLTSASDDLTNPPAMQRWWADMVEGARIIEFPPGYGHLHILVPETNRVLWSHMMGRDPGTPVTGDAGTA